MLHEPTEEALKKASARLHSGELVAFPTETVYGLGADALSESAVQNIFRAKKRPAANPLIVHLASIEQVELVADLSWPRGLKEKLSNLAHLWPGALSVVLPKKAHVPNTVTGGGESVAVRVPNHPVALRLLQIFRGPIAAPSANRSNSVSPTTAKHVEESLGRSLYIIDGGPCQIGLESTVLSLCEEVPTVLRPGAVTLETLREILGEVHYRDSATLTETALPSPGLLRKHYAPNTPLTFRDALPPEAEKMRVGFISFHHSNHEALPFAPAVHLSLSESGDFAQIAAGLFAAIRSLDERGLDLIVVDRCPSTGLGQAIMDRLNRAAAEEHPGVQRENEQQRESC